MKKSLLLALLCLIGLSGMQARTIDLSTETSGDGIIYVQDGDVLTGTLASPLRIIINGGYPTVTLDGVTINGVDNSINDFPGIGCIARITTLILKGTNYICGNYNNMPGIGVGSTSALIIEGDGSLTVQSNGNAAAIGSGFNTTSYNKCGDITINGGNITAIGGNFSAAIGSSRYGKCGNITINGGTINATGGSYAAAIGSGTEGECGNITITDNDDVTAGIKLRATKGTYADYSIGTGNDGTCGTIKVMGQTYINGVSASPYSCQSWDGNLANVTGPVTAHDGVTIRGTLSGNYKVSIASSATVYLKDATIIGTDHSNYKFAGLTCKGDATIILQGTNKTAGFYGFYPGIYIPQGNSLYIEGNGSLTAWSNTSGAGIGGGSGRHCGEIIINGGNIDATGGYGCPGIGGGYNSDCDGVFITQCATRVKAQGGATAPYSIGASEGGNCFGGVHLGVDCTSFNSSNPNTDYGRGVQKNPYIYPLVCNAPSNLHQVGTSGAREFTISWTPAGDEDAWDVGYKEAGASYAYNYINTTRPYLDTETMGLTDFVPNTEYEIAVRAHCDDRTLSDYSAPIRITTKAEGSQENTCAPPTALNAEDVAATSALITWTPGTEDQNTWYVAYTNETSNETSVFRVDEIPYRITNLEPNTPYIVTVFGDCDGIYSETTTIHITTPELEDGIGDIPSDKQSSNKGDCVKVIHNGKFLIDCNGKTYDILGEEFGVKNEE